MTDPLADDKLWAEAMRECTEDRDETFYWTGFRVGLGDRFDLATAIVDGIGAEDETTDAKGRGAELAAYLASRGLLAISPAVLTDTVVFGILDGSHDVSITYQEYVAYPKVFRLALSRLAKGEMT